jgi:tRNA modification GTPase
VDTIFALVTAPGQSGVAVVRVSGPAAFLALRALTPLSRAVAPRVASLRILRDPGTDEVLDQALVLTFPAPNSFTGDDVVELHVHGGRAVVAGIVGALSAMDGLRPAEAGEFSRRAFLAGKLDLTQAEGLADLVSAETAAQRRQALRQFGGALGSVYEGWRADLIGLLAHAEAAIDFPDEDLPDDLGEAFGARIEALRSTMLAHLDDGGRGERLREGVYVAIVGPPNAGKSSLLNWLAQRDVAIVSETAGTTRDVIETHLDLGGYPVILADTAGLRDATDNIEREGVRRALARAEASDLKLLVCDVADPAGLQRMAALRDENALIVLNKCDLGRPRKVAGVPVSAKTGEGMDGLLEQLEEMVAARFGAGEAPVLTRARHRRAVMESIAALERALEAGDDVLRAEDLRLAARSLGRITGRVDVEEILDLVFAEFCIGK